MGQFGAGQAVRRVEDQRLLTGHGRYTDDLTFPGELFAAFVRSPYAHAQIERIEADDARTAPGVLAVLTHDDLSADRIGNLPCKVDLETTDGKPIIKPPRPALAFERVRFVGDIVAMVVAESQAAARDAAEIVSVDYTELPSVVDTGQAAQDSAPQIWNECPLNTSFMWRNGDFEAVDAAFADASHIARVHLINNRIIPSSMEPRIAIGTHDRKPTG